MKTKDEQRQARLEKELRLLRNKAEVRILSVDEARNLNAEIMRRRKELNFYFDCNV